MSFTWLCFIFLVFNIKLSENVKDNQDIKTNSKCDKKGQKIQGFTPLQYFECLQKDKGLYFEARYCQNAGESFYEAEQQCLPNLGGGEIRCMIVGKRCSENILGVTDYPDKSKPNYYMVCLPNAVHIYRCQNNQIFDKNTKECSKSSSPNTTIEKDDSNGVIPDVNCEKPGVHSTVTLKFPIKHDCVLYCEYKNKTAEFLLQIICDKISSLANIPTTTEIITISSNGDNTLIGINDKTDVTTTITSADEIFFETFPIDSFGKKSNINETSSTKIVSTKNTEKNVYIDKYKDSYSNINHETSSSISFPEEIITPSKISLIEKILPGISFTETFLEIKKVTETTTTEKMSSIESNEKESTIPFSAPGFKNTALTNDKGSLVGLSLENTESSYTKLSSKDEFSLLGLSITTKKLTPGEEVSLNGLSTENQLSEYSITDQTIKKETYALSTTANEKLPAVEPSTNKEDIQLTTSKYSYKSSSTTINDAVDVETIIPTSEHDLYLSSQSITSQENIEKNFSKISYTTKQSIHTNNKSTSTSLSPGGSTKQTFPSTKIFQEDISSSTSFITKTENNQTTTAISLESLTSENAPYITVLHMIGPESTQHFSTTKYTIKEGSNIALESSTEGGNIQSNIYPDNKEGTTSQKPNNNNSSSILSDVKNKTASLTNQVLLSNLSSRNEKEKSTTKAPSTAFTSTKNQPEQTIGNSLTSLTTEFPISPVEINNRLTSSTYYNNTEPTPNIIRKTTKTVFSTIDDQSEQASSKVLLTGSSTEDETKQESTKKQTIKESISTIKPILTNEKEKVLSKNPFIPSSSIEYEDTSLSSYTNFKKTQSILNITGQTSTTVLSAIENQTRQTINNVYLDSSSENKERKQSTVETQLIVTNNEEKTSPIEKYSSPNLLKEYEKMLSSPHQNLEKITSTSNIISQTSSTVFSTVENKPKQPNNQVLLNTTESSIKKEEKQSITKLVLKDEVSTIHVSTANNIAKSPSEISSSSSISTKNEETVSSSNQQTATESVTREEVLLIKSSTEHNSIATTTVYPEEDLLDKSTNTVPFDNIKLTVTESTSENARLNKYRFNQDTTKSTSPKKFITAVSDLRDKVTTVWNSVPFSETKATIISTDNIQSNIEPSTVDSNIFIPSTIDDVTSTLSSSRETPQINYATKNDIDFTASNSVPLKPTADSLLSQISTEKIIWFSTESPSLTSSKTEENQPTSNKNKLPSSDTNILEGISSEGSFDKQYSSTTYNKETSKVVGYTETSTIQPSASSSIPRNEEAILDNSSLRVKAETTTNNNFAKTTLYPVDITSKDLGDNFSSSKDSTSSDKDSAISSTNNTTVTNPENLKTSVSKLYSTIAIPYKEVLVELKEIESFTTQLTTSTLSTKQNDDTTISISTSDSTFLKLTLGLDAMTETSKDQTELLMVTASQHSTDSTKDIIVESVTSPVVINSNKTIENLYSHIKTEASSDSSSKFKPTSILNTSTEIGPQSSINTQYSTISTTKSNAKIVPNLEKKSIKSTTTQDINIKLVTSTAKDETISENMYSNFEVKPTTNVELFTATPIRNTASEILNNKLSSSTVSESYASRHDLKISTTEDIAQTISNKVTNLFEPNTPEDVVAHSAKESYQSTSKQTHSHLETKSTLYKTYLRTTLTPIDSTENFNNTNTESIPSTSPPTAREKDKSTLENLYFESKTAYKPHIIFSTTILMPVDKMKTPTERQESLSSTPSDSHVNTNNSTISNTKYITESFSGYSSTSSIPKKNDNTTVESLYLPSGTEFTPRESSTSFDSYVDKEHFISLEKTSSNFNTENGITIPATVIEKDYNQPVAITTKKASNKSAIEHEQPDFETKPIPNPLSSSVTLLPSNRETSSETSSYNTKDSRQSTISEVTTSKVSEDVAIQSLTTLVLENDETTLQSLHPHLEVKFSTESLIRDDITKAAKVSKEYQFLTSSEKSINEQYSTIISSTTKDAQQTFSTDQTKTIEHNITQLVTSSSPIDIYKTTEQLNISLEVESIPNTESNKNTVLPVDATDILNNNQDNLFSKSSEKETSNEYLTISSQKIFFSSPKEMEEMNPNTVSALPVAVTDGNNQDNLFPRSLVKETSDRHTTISTEKRLSSSPTEIDKITTERTNFSLGFETTSNTVSSKNTVLAVDVMDSFKNKDLSPRSSEKDTSDEHFTVSTAITNSFNNRIQTTMTSDTYDTITQSITPFNTKEKEKTNTDLDTTMLVTETLENTESNLLSTSIKSSINKEYSTISNKFSTFKKSQNPLGKETEYAKTTIVYEGSTSQAQINETTTNSLFSEFESESILNSSLEAMHTRFTNLPTKAERTDTSETLPTTQNYEKIPTSVTESSILSLTENLSINKNYATVTITTPDEQTTSEANAVTFPTDSFNKNYSTEALTRSDHSTYKSHYNTRRDSESSSDSTIVASSIVPAKSYSRFIEEKSSITSKLSSSQTTDSSLILTYFNSTTTKPNSRFKETTDFASVLKENKPSLQLKYKGDTCQCVGRSRYRNNCKKYFYCRKIGNSKRYVQSKIMECQNCFQFNARKRICDFPENVPECSVDNKKPDRICTEEGNYTIPLENNCRKYYECKKNWRGIIALQVKLCPVGRVFSERFEKCVRGCRCINSKKFKVECNSPNAVLPDKLDCSKFYYCIKEKERQTLGCSTGYVFDGKRCELKSEVICDPTNVLRYMSSDDDENCNH